MMNDRSNARPAERIEEPARVEPVSLRSYRSSAKAMHWLIVLLVAIQFVVALLMPDFGPHVVPTSLINLHLSIGIVILVVMAVRGVHRLLYPVPLDMRASPAWERAAARATHLAFYFILLVGPVLGWASASAHGVPVTVFGELRLPDIAPLKARWALTAGDVHIYMMWTLLALIALHAAAALYHQFVRRDGLLMRMLPTSEN